MPRGGGDDGREAQEERQEVGPRRREVKGGHRDRQAEKQVAEERVTRHTENTPIAGETSDHRLELLLVERGGDGFREHRTAPLGRQGDEAPKQIRRHGREKRLLARDERSPVDGDRAIVRRNALDGVIRIRRHRRRPGGWGRRTRVRRRGGDTPGIGKVDGRQRRQPEGRQQALGGAAEQRTRAHGPPAAEAGGEEGDGVPLQPEGAVVEVESAQDQEQDEAVAHAVLFRLKSFPRKTNPPSAATPRSFTRVLPRPLLTTTAAAPPVMSAVRPIAATLSPCVHSA